MCRVQSHQYIEINISCKQFYAEIDLQIDMRQMYHLPSNGKTDIETQHALTLRSSLPSLSSIPALSPGDAICRQLSTASLPSPPSRTVAPLLGNNFSQEGGPLWLARPATGRTTDGPHPSDPLGFTFISLSIYLSTRVGTILSNHETPNISL